MNCSDRTECLLKVGVGAMHDVHYSNPLDLKIHVVHIKEFSKQVKSKDTLVFSPLLECYMIYISNSLLFNIIITCRILKYFQSIFQYIPNKLSNLVLTSIVWSECISFLLLL